MKPKKIHNETKENGKITAKTWISSLQFTFYRKMVVTFINDCNTIPFKIILEIMKMRTQVENKIMIGFTQKQTGNPRKKATLEQRNK